MGESESWISVKKIKWFVEIDRRVTTNDNK